MQEDTCELCYEYDLGCNDRCKYCALGNRLHSRDMIMNKEKD